MLKFPETVNASFLNQKAQNLVSGTGIAKVVVTQGGAGYSGNPTVEITDADFNASGAPGSYAVLTLTDGINALNEINSDAVQVIDLAMDM